WAYIHARNVTARTNTYEELIPLCDYLFRYDRGSFWMGSHALLRFAIPNTQFFRTMLDSFLHTRQLLKAMHSTHISQQYIVQDVCVPYAHTPAFVRAIEDGMNTYPLWLCPSTTSDPANFSPVHLDTDFAFNVGIYGKGLSNYQEFLSFNRLIERDT